MSLEDLVVGDEEDEEEKAKAAAAPVVEEEEPPPQEGVPWSWVGVLGAMLGISLLLNLIQLFSG